MNKGLVSSLILSVLVLSAIIGHIMTPQDDDDIIALVFPPTMPAKDAFTSVIAAGGQPLSTGLNAHILIIARTEAFKKNADQSGALFQFRALGAWGCSSSQAKAAFAKQGAL